MNVLTRLGVLMVAAGVLGCGGRSSDPIAEGPAGVFRPATSMDVSATEYRVAPPDKLLILASGIKEVESTVTIRPDGMIQLNPVGEVYVAGMTPGEIGRVLTAAVAKYYNNATVRVDVAEYNSKSYTVFGTAVRDGGRKPYTGRDTVIYALASAGFTEDAWPQQVHVSRPRAGANGEPATAIVDMTAVYLRGDTRQNYLLQEGDVIYVPDSPLVAWNKAVVRVVGPFTGVTGGVSAAQGVRPAAAK
jgi:polysaccharide export outer membrane protein